MIWLYPGEWYASIPEGYEVVDVFGDIEVFVPGTTDDSTRYGALPYGFIRKEGIA